MQKVETTFGPVRIGQEALDGLNDWLKHAEPTLSRVFVLVDENTHEHCLPTFCAALPSLPPVEILEIPSGEESKSLEMVTSLLEALQEHRADRNSLLLSLGGGVVTDLGGLVASLYMRGIRHVVVPTSLLGMVDASIGGKTGVNLAGIKNSIGTFSPAEGVYCYPPFLDTLPEKEVLSGLAEMLKHALLMGESALSSWEALSSTGNEEFALALVESVQCKARFVNRDPSDHLGIRAALNMGHTVGHALESVLLSTGLTHGEAVAAGLWIESLLAEQVAGLPSSTGKRIRSSIDQRYKRLPRVDFDLLWKKMHRDKKNQSEQVTFVLLHALGQDPILYPVGRSLVLDAVEKYGT